jgi:hypothetical protein
MYGDRSEIAEFFTADEKTRPDVVRVAITRDLSEMGRELIPGNLPHML